jgi:uncharacterized pyridoxal phosphate-containing UPF0001 family protein
MALRSSKRGRFNVFENLGEVSKDELETLRAETRRLAKVANQRLVRLEKESKFGVSPEETEQLIRQAAVLPGLRIAGLMTIAPYTPDAESNRPYFRQLRELSVDIKSKCIDNVTMDHLSMGMTGDYQVAIEEGATLIRVGTGIFGERNYD